MRKPFLAVLAILTLLSIAAALKKSDIAAVSAVPSDSSARLPVKRVVLYKNGVGYFEHSARVHGNQDLTIDFTTAQLNRKRTSPEGTKEGL